MESDIGPVERVFILMFEALDGSGRDLVLAGLHEKLNRDTSVIMRCRDKIETYLVDPYRFGSKSLIGELDEILLEATQ